MPTSVKQLRGYEIQARDGELGKVDDILFDSEDWVIRYLVVNAGNWLIGRKVLLSPISVAAIDPSTETLQVNLTRAEVEGSPPLASDQPVSRQYESDMLRHFGYLPYWGGGLVWGLGPYPTSAILPAERTAERDAAWRKEAELRGESGDPNLRSAREVSGYKVRALDADLGEVEDFLFDDQSWMIDEIIIDTRKWLPGKRVTISPSSVTGVTFVEGRLEVALTKDAIIERPEFVAPPA